MALTYPLSWRIAYWPWICSRFFWMHILYSLSHHLKMFSPTIHYKRIIPVILNICLNKNHLQCFFLKCWFLGYIYKDSVLVVMGQAHKSAFFFKQGAECPGQKNAQECSPDDYHNKKRPSYTNLRCFSCSMSFSTFIRSPRLLGESKWSMFLKEPNSVTK